MGTGLTRLGVGPNGETRLTPTTRPRWSCSSSSTGSRRRSTAPKACPYSASNGATARRASPSATTSTWRCRTASSRASPSRCPTTAVQLAGHRRRGATRKASFRIRRAKFKLEGWFYKPTLEFELQLNWPDVNNTPPSQFLEDANIDWDLSKKKNKAFRLRFGQFKAPFGRQQLTSSGAQQFVDRAHPGRALQRRARDRPRAVGHALDEQARLARDGLERQRPHPGRQRQRQVPLHRARHVAGGGQRAHEPVGFGRRS